VAIVMTNIMATIMAMMTFYADRDYDDEDDSDDKDGNGRRRTCAPVSARSAIATGTGVAMWAIVMTRTAITTAAAAEHSTAPPHQSDAFSPRRESDGLLA
jgi:hypothetical protein